MRVFVLVGLMSASVTVAVLDTWMNHKQALSPFHEAAAQGKWEEAAAAIDGSMSLREARHLSQAAIAMEMADRMEEADYLYSEAVRAAGQQYGHDHPITESYRRRYLSFYYKLQGRASGGTPIVQIEQIATVSTAN